MRRNPCARLACEEAGITTLTPDAQQASNEHLRAGSSNKTFGMLGPPIFGVVEASAFWREDQVRKTMLDRIVPGP